MGGGRTRTRTWDPLIKSQLLYQLSYAPGSPVRETRASGRPVAKRRPACPASGRRRASCARKRKPPGWPGGFAGRGDVGEGNDRRRRVVARQRPRRRGAASSRDRLGPPAHAQQHAKAALLAVVEALVERLGGVGELLERAARALMASAPWRRRAIASGRGVAGALSHRARARGGVAIRSARSLARSRIAASTAGQFFSCSAVSRSPALSAATRASVNAATSSALGCQRWDRAARRAAAPVARAQDLRRRCVSAIMAATIVLIMGDLRMACLDDASRGPHAAAVQVKVWS